MRLLVYTVLRLALVLAAAGALYLAGMRSWALWATALVVAALVSFLVLGKQRDAAAHVLAEHDPLRRAGPRFSPAVEADAAYEDAVVDAGDAPAAGTVPGGRPAAGTTVDGPRAGRTGSSPADRPDLSPGAAGGPVHRDEPPVTG